MNQSWIILGASSSMAKAFARLVADRGDELRHVEGVSTQSRHQHDQSDQQNEAAEAISHNRRNLLMPLPMIRFSNIRPRHP